MRPDTANVGVLAVDDVGVEADDGVVGWPLLHALASRIVASIQTRRMLLSLSDKRESMRAVAVSAADERGASRDGGGDGRVADRRRRIAAEIQPSDLRDGFGGFATDIKIVPLYVKL